VSVDALLALLAGGGDQIESIDADGHLVHQLEHALQTAAVLEAEGADDDLVAAGLVHDVGHLLPDGFHLDDHEVVGAELVRPVLGDRVADLVALHVPAKRYLSTVGDYELSAGSVASLEAQGGTMTPAERATFEAHPAAADAVRLRRADEAAKVPGAAVGGLDRWRPLLEAVSRRSHTEGTPPT
jgi:predicted HD phosphohydrolase